MNATINKRVKDENKVRVVQIYTFLHKVATHQKFIKEVQYNREKVNEKEYSIKSTYFDANT